MPNGESGEERAADDVTAWCDAHAPAVFAWLCRLVGGQEATNLLPEVFVKVLPVMPVEPDALLAVAFGLATASAVESASLEDPEPTVSSEPALLAAPSDLTVLDRALLDLHSVQGRSAEDIAAIIGRPSSEIAGIASGAEQRARDVFPDSTFAEIGRSRETWLDDQTRARCREAITGITDSSDPADGGRPAGARPARGARSARGPMSARARAVAVVAVVALLSLGLYWLHSGTEPSTRDSATPTTPASGPTEAPGFVLGTAPAGFVAAGSVRIEAAPSGGSAPGQLQLWATPDAQRTAGRWFAVVTERCAPIDTSITVASGASARVSVNGVSGVITGSADGVRTLRAQSGTNELTSRTLVVEAFGYTNDQLVAVASTVLLGDRVKDPSELATPSCATDQPDVVTEFDASFGAVKRGMKRLLALPWYGSTTLEPDTDGRERRIVEYRSASSQVPVRVTTRTLDEHHATLVRFLQPASDDPQAPRAPARSAEVAGRDATVSAAIDAAGVVIGNAVEFVDGNRMVDVSAPGTLAEMRAILATARLATDTEWADLRVTGTGANPPIDPSSRPLPSAPPLSVAQLVDVGSSTTASGMTWQLLVGTDPDVLQFELPALGAVYQEPFTLGSGPAVHAFYTVDSTIIVASLVPPAPGLSVRVTVAGIAGQPAALRAAKGDVQFAIVAFDDVGPITVDLVNPDGSVVLPLSAIG
ncbi:MAG: hypothetical protein JWL72_216 [Ilumatobacteraceae bacterium]|nr:hypothetical protein [Ilumatobacteraceae bacterium]MCU1386878.1 hypothetical protein [Ilumatobacteraceae bacterium]